MLPCSARRRTVAARFIEQISRCDRCLGGIELGGSPLGIGVDESLLINPPHALDSTDVEDILTTEIPGMSGLDFTMGNIIFLFLLQHLHLRLGQYHPSLGDMLFQGG